MAKINLEKIISIISSTIEENQSKISIKSKSSDFFKWDSLNQLNIMIKVEKILKRKIPTSKISELNTVKKIFNYVNNIK